MLVVLAGFVGVIVVRHDRYLADRDGWLDVPWDASWPSLPALSAASTISADFMRALYAFAGRNQDMLKHIPCFCGCRLQGHRSNHDCYVAHRAANGHVSAWNAHGTMCPLGPEITGDVMIRHHRGVPLATIRQQIDGEFGRHGTPTPTPLPP